MFLCYANEYQAFGKAEMSDKQLGICLVIIYWSETLEKGTREACVMVNCNKWFRVNCNKAWEYFYKTNPKTCKKHYITIISWFNASIVNYPEHMYQLGF